MYADMVFYNGKIITLDNRKPLVSALAVQDEKICEIGDYDDVKGLIGQNTMIMDLNGKTVTPGFVDAHLHLISLGLAMQVIDMRGITSKSALLNLIKDRAAVTPSKNWIRGYGFEESLLDSLPTRKDLDPISLNNPVYLEDLKSRICILNTFALKKSYMEKNIAKGVIVERDSLDNEITGIIRSDNQDLLNQVLRIPTIDPVDDSLEKSELKRAIEVAWPKVIEAGVTSVHDIQLPPNGLRAFKELFSERKIPIRVDLGCDRGRDVTLKGYVEYGLGEELYLNRLKIDMVKMFADGRITVSELKRRVIEIHEAGYQLAIHSFDKGEVEQTLEAIEEALKMKLRKNHRHRIEHAFIRDKSILERIKNLEIIISTQPEILFEFDGDFPKNVEVAHQHVMIKEGITIIGGSDSPLIDRGRRAPLPKLFPTPLNGICFAVSGRSKNRLLLQKDERISLLDALKIHSRNGAYASFEEAIKGTICKGKLADLVILSEDITNIAPEEIKNVRIEKTIIGGKIVYS